MNCIVLPAIHYNPSWLIHVENLLLPLTWTKLLKEWQLAFSLIFPIEPFFHAFTRMLHGNLLDVMLYLQTFQTIWTRTLANNFPIRILGLTRLRQWDSIFKFEDWFHYIICLYVDNDRPSFLTVIDPSKENWISGRSTFQNTSSSPRYQGTTVLNISC